MASEISALSGYLSTNCCQTATAAMADSAPSARLRAKRNACEASSVAMSGVPDGGAAEASGLSSEKDWTSSLATILVEPSANLIQ